jgi:hypothetical protein
MFSFITAIVPMIFSPAHHQKCVRKRESGGERQIVRWFHSVSCQDANSLRLGRLRLLDHTLNGGNSLIHVSTIHINPIHEPQPHIRCPRRHTTNQNSISTRVCPSPSPSPSRQSQARVSCSEMKCKVIIDRCKMTPVQMYVSNDHFITSA